MSAVNFFASLELKTKILIFEGALKVAVFFERWLILITVHLSRRDIFYESIRE